nr:hypothetical protein 21 [Elusimicrobiota bacterium]
MGNVNNLQVGFKIGAGAVKIGDYGTPEGSCIDLGYTKGGAEIVVERKYVEQEVDNEIGIVNVFKTAERMTIKLPLAEVSLENLARIMDYPLSAISSGVFSFGGDENVNPKTIFMNINKSDGGTRKFEVYKCMAISGGGHKYSKEDETICEVEFLVIQDTTKPSKQQIGKITDTGSDTTAPTISMTSPSPGGTVDKDTQDPVVFTWVEANLINESSIRYGDTFQIIDKNTNTLVAGALAIDRVLKTVTFTPDSNWSSGDEFLASVSTGFEDNSGNGLTSTYIADFSVTL